MRKQQTRRKKERKKERSTPRAPRALVVVLRFFFFGATKQNNKEKGIFMNRGRDKINETAIINKIFRVFGIVKEREGRGEKRDTYYNTTFNFVLLLI